MRSDVTHADSVRTAVLCAAVTCALASLEAHAVGLGSIEVKSKLDQPFVAEIPLTLNTSEEGEGLIVRIASPEAFERVGMDPNTLAANLQFTVARNARGEPIVRVTTPQRMSDPYVTFLLEADWGNGKMVREYTALLDPPHTASVPRRAISAPVVASTPLPAPVEPPPPPIAQPVATQEIPAPPPAASPQPVEPETFPSPGATDSVATAPQPEIESTPVAAAPEAATESAPSPAPFVEAAPPTPAPVADVPVPITVEPAPAAGTPGAVTVAQGQTLSGIAEQLRPADVSVNRMMIALQRANPDAFLRGNINLLKRGAVLRMPGSDDALAITAAEANALVHDQVESWREGAQPAPQLQPEESSDATGNVAASAASKPKSEVAGASPDKPKRSHAASTTAEIGAATTPTIASTQKPSKPRGARLEIVPPIGPAATRGQSGASEGGAGSELRAELSQTKEELAARKAEIGDLKSRVSDLEKMQQDSTQLLSMKDSQLAELQKRLADLERAEASAPAAPGSVAATDGVVEPAASGTIASAAGPEGTMVPASSATAAPPPAMPASAPATATPSAPPDAPAPWYFNLWILVGGGLLALAGILGLMLKRKHVVEPAPRPRSFDTGALAASMAAARAASRDPAQDDVPVRAPIPHDGVTAERSAVDVRVDAPPAAVEAAAPVEAPAPVEAAAHDDDWDPPPPQVSDAASPAPARSAPVESPRTVGSKLDLARAYIEVGDHDGARSVLEEVLIEGNADQKEQAFALLDQLDAS